MRYLIILLLLTGCVAKAEHWERIDGKLVLTEKMRISGYGAKRAKFKGESEIERTEPAKVPDAIVK